LLFQKSSENYKEIGSELKVLLSEMRNLISENKSSPRDDPLPEVTQRSSKVKHLEHPKPRSKPKALDEFPTFKKKNQAFVHCR